MGAQTFHFASECSQNGKSSARIFVIAVLMIMMMVCVCVKKVRTTGAYDQITKQPVHGRKKGGGIRLGEMERDSIISHGAAYLLHDRLFNCSDGAEVILPSSLMLLLYYGLLVHF